MAEGPFRAIRLGPYTNDGENDGASLLVDDSYCPDGTRRGVLVCHSAGQSHDDQIRPEWWPIPRGLAETGRFVCLACDFGDSTVEYGPTSGRYSWGNEHAIARMSEAYRYLIGKEGGAKKGPIVVAATSMGAVLGLNWTMRYRHNVCAVILACPVLDLAALYTRTGDEDLLHIGAAYGVRPPVPIPQLPACSPVMYAAKLRGIPIRIYASSDDTIAADTSSCREFATRVGGDDIEVRDLGAVGHWPIETPLDDALRFAGRFA
jgi:pimeloyl-ACP methyl ester carboxylesterase